MPGARIARYEIVRELGQGGMGLVYLAHDPTLDRPVALKLLRPELRSAQARLLREGQSVARLAHPNVVRVFDVGTDRDDLFIAMEYVDGATLGQWLAAERRRSSEILALFAAAGRGLIAAHAAGVVHRDFKPDNVLVGRDGRVVVTDFGLARLDTEAAEAGADARAAWQTVTLTRTGGLLGTPAYMSPEQLRGEVADARSDQFSFCVAHWEALFGSRPFAIPPRASLDEVRAAVEGGISAPGAPPGRALAAAERALRRGLSRDPAERYPDMTALIAALDPPGAHEGAAVVGVGDTVAHFRIHERIGQGGMGIVYRAVDAALGREVALKLLPPEVVARADRRERFLREARAAAAVIHPAIATVYEVGTDGDVPYIAMEFVAGRTLREVLGAGPLAVAELLRIATPIADALARAHRAGIVHRDLKPENVMLDGDGAPKILDFGLARVLDVGAALDAAGNGAAGGPLAAAITEDGTVIGTPAYMSPEQARGQAVDHRSDLFSLGTMLFELLTAQSPFRGSSTIDIATAIIRDAPPTPSTIALEVPPELDRIVLKCLEKDPEDRFQSASELVVDLRRLQRHTQSGISPAGAQIALPPRNRRGRPAWIWFAAGATVLAAASAVWLVRGLSAPASPSGTPPSARGRDSSTALSARAVGSAATAATATDRQLTASASRAAQAAQLSPDGRQLLLLQDGRITLQDIATGAIRDLAGQAVPPNWARWFPDGRRLLLGVPSGPTQLDLVAMPIDGGASEALPMHPWGAAISPDGARLATYDQAGIRVSRLDGSDVRLLVGTREEAEFVPPTWSPDARWIAYAVRGPDLKPQIRAVAADGSSDVLLVDDQAIAPPAGLPSYTWLADGRLLYNTHGDGGSALVALDVDPATGRSRGEPRTLASYSEMTELENASRDGGALLYVRHHLRLTRYRGKLAAGAFTVEPTAHQSWDLIGATPDGKTEVYLSGAGTGRIELIALGADPRPRLLASFVGIVLDPRLTPSGDAVLYLHVDAVARQVSLRRLALVGGEPVVVEVLPYAPAVPAQYTRQLVVQLGCARAPAEGCVLGASEGRQQVFYAVDPARGRGRKLVALDGPPPWSWDLRPDGTRVAVAHQDQAVRIVELATGRTTEAITSPGLMADELAWLGNSGSFLISGYRSTDSQVVRIDASAGGGVSGARRTALWTSTSEAVRILRVSSDARAVSFRGSSWSRDYWLRRESAR